jgi:hypothetical protein
MNIYQKEKKYIFKLKEFTNIFLRSRAIFSAEQFMREDISPPHETNVDEMGWSCSRGRLPCMTSCLNRLVNAG